MTDGRTKDDIQAITEQMKTNDDVIVIAVGLYRAPLAELTQIATSDDLVFYTKDFHRIWNFFTQLTKKMCSLHPKGNDFTIELFCFMSILVTGEIVKQKVLYWTQQKNHRQPFQS